MGTSERIVRGRAVAVVAAVVVAGVLALYLVLISQESGNRSGRVALVVLLFLVALACLIGCIVLDTPAARGAAGAGAAGLLVSFSYLALFSIGLLVAIGAIMSIVWLVRTRQERAASSRVPTIASFVAGALLPWSLVLVG